MRGGFTLALTLIGTCLVTLLPSLRTSTEAVASEPPRYAIVDLGALAGGPPGGNTEAKFINQRGQVAGDGWCCNPVGVGGFPTDAFVWQPGQASLRDLGTLVGFENSNALAFSLRGDVVGFVWLRLSSREHAFLWQPTTGMRDLDGLGGDFSVADGINKRGQVVGYAATRAEGIRAFLWQEGKAMQDLGVLPGSKGGSSRAFGINDRGQIAGDSSTASGPSHAVIWQPRGGIQDLGTLGGTSSVAQFINNRGQVAGTSETSQIGVTHAFLWQERGSMQDLGNLGKLNIVVRGLNNRGEVVGHSTSRTGNEHAFIWQPGRGMLDLGTLGGSTSDAFGINDRGQVVGISDTAIVDPALCGSPIFACSHAFVWQPETGMLDLGTLGGSARSEATSINNRGQIVGGSGGHATDQASHAVIWQRAEDEGDLVDEALPDAD
ncbi:MAG: HAF repeat-containing protein [Chloroflexi bacterium]|nr:HAF repeat-containing protein [Chloroflexota bacterium]